MTDESFAIETHLLTKRFGRLRALDAVDARIPTGSIYGLIGPNGAGKTTFVRCMLNLINPSGGSATVLGHDVVRDSLAVRRRVGHVAALQSLWDWMTVQQLAEFMAGLYPRWDSDAVNTILSHVGIPLDAKLGFLSRGQRALASLAVAIGHEPDLLFLDEALTGLDPIARREVMRNIIEAMHAEGRTVFITGQDIADMERICDHIGFLVKGKLVIESPLDDLKARVKRLRVQHPPDAPLDLPQTAQNVQRAPRETIFTVPDYTPALAESLDGPSRQVEVVDLSLEDIFVEIAQPQLEAQQ